MESKDTSRFTSKIDLSNREYKSDVFSMLLEEKENAISVYNALNGTDYPDDTEIEITTLDSGISLSVRNDASFIICSTLNIYEHQSTFCPNMPLRSLFYISSILQKRLKGRDLFSTRRVLIPTPHFVVIYNGLEERPEKEILKLSDSFFGKNELPEMELICTVININPKKNAGIKEKSRVLAEYTLFVEKVRENVMNGVDVPIRSAIIYCKENNILRDFLSRRGMEVEKNMQIDMTWEAREPLIRKEEYEAGREEGMEEGLDKGIEILTLLKSGKSVAEIETMGYSKETAERMAVIIKK